MSARTIDALPVLQELLEADFEGNEPTEYHITKANDHGWMVEDHVALIILPESGERYLVTVQEVTA